MYAQNSLVLFKKGLSVIPSHTERKGPFLKDWQTYSERMPTLEEVKDWNIKYPLKNITLMLGKASKLIALDIDFEDEHHVNEILKMIPSSPIMKKGKKGLTAFYKYKGEITERIKWGDRIAVEILSDGTNTVIPPSIHPETKKPYFYLSEVSLDKINFEEIPILPEVCIRKIREYTSLLPVSTNKDRNEGTQTDTSRTMKLKDIVVAKLNQGTSIEPIVREIMSYDKKHHNPPLLEDPTEGICKADIFTNALSFVSSIATSLNKNRMKTGENPLIPLNFKDENTPEKIELTRLGDLLNEPEEIHSYLVDNLLPTGGSSLLFAKPKAGKSTLARNIALAVAQGKEILGRKVQKSTVIYLALEEKRSEIQRHFKDMNANGKEDILIKAGFINSPTPELLIELVSEHKPGFIIIDTLNAFIRFNDGNDYSKILNALLPYIGIARDYDTHIMFVHHARKNDENPFDAILGSTAILASIDSAIYLKRTDESNYIQTRQRYGQDLESHFLDLDQETRTFQLGTKTSTAKESKLKNQILAFLKEYDSEVPLNDIKENVEGKVNRIISELNTLTKDGIILESGRGVKNDPKKYIIAKNNFPAF